MKNFLHKILLFIYIRLLKTHSKLKRIIPKEMYPLLYILYIFLSPMLYTSTGILTLYFWHNIFSDYIILSLFGLAGPIGIILSIVGYYFLGEYIYYIIIPLCIIKSLFFIVMFIIIFFDEDN